MKEFDEKKNSKNIEKKLQSNLSKDEIIRKAFQYHSQGNIAEASKYYQFLSIKDSKITEFFKILGKS